MGRLPLPGVRRPGRGELRSRHDRPLSRYFPELVEPLSELSDDSFVLDGEILVMSDGGGHA